MALKTGWVYLDSLGRGQTVRPNHITKSFLGDLKIMGNQLSPIYQKESSEGIEERILFKSNKTMRNH